VPLRPFDQLTRLGRIRRLASIARRALDERGIDEASLRFLTDDTNILFRARAAAGTFVVRIGVHGPIAHSLPEAEAETAWLAALRASGLTVPDPVPDLTGRLVTPIALRGVDGERLVVVFRWIPGGLLEGHLSRANLAAYGALAARLHRHAGGFRPPGDPPLPRYDHLFPFDQPEVLFAGGNTPLLPPRRLAVFRAAAERVTEAITRLRATQPMRLLHGDLHVWNVLLHRGRLAPIDFEDLMWGWPVQDIGTALYYLQHRPDFPAILGDFRRGYEEVAPWPEPAPGDLDTFIAGRALVLANDVLQMSPVDLGELDVPEFFARAERRLRATLEGGRFEG